MNNMFDIFKNSKNSEYLNLTKAFNIFNNNIVEAQETRSSFSDKDIIEYAEDCYKKVFNVKYANVKPHTRVLANKIVFASLLSPKDKVLSLKMFKNESEVYEEEIYFDINKYNAVYFNVDKETEQLNYNNIRSQVILEKPKIIYINTSFYPRLIDYEELYNIAIENNAYLVIDISEISGLVVTKLIDNPSKFTHILITSTSGSLRGLNGGVILSNHSEIIKKIDSNIDMYQGNPLINMIASKIVVANNILNADFNIYHKQVIKNIKVLSDVFKSEEIKVVYNGTDNHEIMIDVKESLNITGKEAESLLKSINIICNKTLIPNDETTPYITSGIKFSALVATSKGLKEKDFLELGRIIIKCLKNNKDLVTINNLKKQVSNLIGELLL